MGSLFTKQTHQRLGNDQLMEIFSRMPAKAVIKFTSLSKSLSTLLSDPLFVERQTIFSSCLDGGFFIEPKCIRYFTDKLEFYILPGDDGGLPCTLGIPAESISFLQQNGVVLASSQGLVLVVKKSVDCYMNDAKEFLICNPATRRWATIPIPDWLSPLLFINWSGVVFECHPKYLETYPTDSSDYTIIVPMWVGGDGIRQYFSSYKLFVYCNGTWEATCELRMELNGRLFTFMSVGLFRGCDGGLVVHYLGQSAPHKDVSSVFEEPYIVAYDIKRKAQSRTFKIPNGAWDAKDQGVHPWKWRMFKWRWSSGDTIGLARIHEMEKDCMLTVWVLEDYERGSWRRVVRKTIKEMGVPEEDNVKFVVVGCCVVNGTVLAFSTRRRVYMYKMVGPDAGRLEVVWEREDKSCMMLNFISYANTLRPVCGGEESYGYDEMVCGEESYDYEAPTPPIPHLVETRTSHCTFVDILDRCFPLSYFVSILRRTQQQQTSGLPVQQQTSGLPVHAGPGDQDVRTLVQNLNLSKFLLESIRMVDIL